ncbi:MAG: ATPase domain-containing protein [Nanoarchaeota archaeon]
MHKLKNRVPFGISNFDKLVEGGFENSSTNLIVGGPGSGKTIFATQFLVNCMKRKEKCLLVTFEENKQQFYQHMLEFGWDLADYEKKGLFTFLEYAPAKVKTMLEEGGGSIETTIISKKISRLVIDSITSFALLFEDELTKREAALNLFNMIRKWNCTSLLTLELNPSEESLSDKAQTKAIEFESDSIIQIYFLRNKDKRERFIEILKMRGTNHSDKIYKLDIGNKGITISKSSSSLPKS